MSNFETCGAPIRASNFKERFEAFLANPNYIILVMLLCGVANIASQELIVYGIYTLLAVYILVFAQDVLGLMPLIMAYYLAPSTANNPGRNHLSIFSFAQGGWLILIYGILLSIAMLIRIVRDRGQLFTKKNALISGILVLSAGYLLSGLGSAAYPESLGKNLLFAFVQCCTIALPYWLFSGCVNWKKVRVDYFAWLGFCVGLLLLAELGWIYLNQSVVIDGIIHRQQIYTGWGIHNNIGGLLAMMIPFAFYLATKYHKGWIGTVVGSGLLICVFLTCSRSSILVGSGIYAVCIYLMLHYARNRRANTIALVTICGSILLILVCFHKELLLLFSDILSRGLDPSNRDSIYTEGWKLFAQAPILGNSFYSPGYLPWDWSQVASFSEIFPPRWHNTIIQLLTSCGIVGLVAYLFHRFQTARFFLKNPSKEANFIGLSILVLLLSSLFDCHFFNIGPVLFYSMALAFAEHCHELKNTLDAK